MNIKTADPDWTDDLLIERDLADYIGLGIVSLIPLRSKWLRILFFWEGSFHFSKVKPFATFAFAEGVITGDLLIRSGLGIINNDDPHKLVADVCLEEFNAGTPPFILDSHPDSGSFADTHSFLELIALWGIRLGKFGGTASVEMAEQLIQPFRSPGSEPIIHQRYLYSEGMNPAPSFEVLTEFSIGCFEDNGFPIRDFL